jgi:hypothetical protein
MAPFGIVVDVLCVSRLWIKRNIAFPQRHLQAGPANSARPSSPRLKYSDTEMQVTAFFA